MKETMNSLRIYFGLSAALVAWLTINAASGPSLSPPDAALTALTALLGVGYGFLAVTLPDTLKTRPKLAEQILLAALVLTVVRFAGSVVVGDPAYVSSAFGVVMVWYLRASCRRLATSPSR